MPSYSLHLGRHHAQTLAHAADIRDGPLNTLMLITGVWLITGSWFLAYPLSDPADDARLQEVLGGMIVVAVACAKFVRRRGPAFDVVVAVVGGWLIAAPFVFGYADGSEAGGAPVNDIASGAVLFALAAASLAVSVQERRHHIRDDHP